VVKYNISESGVYPLSFRELVPTEELEEILKTNLALLESWMAKQEGFFHLVSPRAGAIAFASYHLKTRPIQLANKFLQEKSVLVVPGEHFAMENYLRFGYGIEKEHLIRALALIEEVLEEIRKNIV